MPQHMVKMPTPLYDRSEVIVRDGCVWMVGENDRCALYAVYDFLRARLGVGFYGPGDLHEVVPAHQELSLGEGLILSQGSVFPIRNYYVPTDAGVIDFYAKNRVNTIMFESDKAGDKAYEKAMTEASRQRGLMIRGPGHNWRQYVPDKGLFDRHPEYFPMFDGKRGVNGRTACFSNPKVREIFMDNLRTYLRNGPQWDVFAFWSEDVFDRSYCDCPECSAKPLGEWYMLLANEAAAVLEQERPAARFEFIVYQATRDMYHPIKGGPLGIRACANADNYSNYRQWMEYLDGCGFVGQKLLMEYFNLCEWQSFGPRGKSLLWPMEVARQDALNYLRDGWQGLYNCDGFDRLCWPMPFYHWCWLQLYHDPHVEIDSLRQEFYAAWFGPAAEAVAAYIDALERAMDQRTSGANVQAVKELAPMLGAISAGGNAALAHRLEALKVHHEWCVLMKEIFLAVHQLDKPRWRELEKPYRQFWQKHRQTLWGEIDLPPMFAFNLYDWILSNPNATRTPEQLAADPTLH